MAGLLQEMKLSWIISCVILGLPHRCLTQDAESTACYSDVPRCGQHDVQCPEGHTVVITNGRYAHLSRMTSCSRGKLTECSRRYLNVCCRLQGNECFNRYTSADAESLLKMCLGPRSCSHMTPQIHKSCAPRKLTVSTMSVVSSRCVANSLITGFDQDKTITSKQVYLRNRLPVKEPKLGIARVYSCEVNGPSSVKVKVKAVGVIMKQVKSLPCSFLEVVKDGATSKFTCDATTGSEYHQSFLSVLYETSPPFAVNMGGVSGNPPVLTWLLLDASANVTVECGILLAERVMPMIGATTSVTTSASTSTVTTTTTATTTTTTVTTTTTTTSPTAPTPEPETVSEVGQQSASTLSTTPNMSSTDPSSISGASATGVMQAPDPDSGLMYGSVAGALLLLLLLVILISIICYRKKRYRRYQSRKVEERRNIPDGQEHPSDRKDSEKHREGHKGGNPDYIRGGNKDKSRDDTSPPLTSAEGDEPKTAAIPSSPSVTYDPTRLERAKQGDSPFEFYDNPGFRTTLETVKIS